MLISLKEFIKKLIAFDVLWGRRTKKMVGIRDGGADAASIGDPDIAKEWNGNTIYNVNHPNNICTGGHYHSVEATKEKCFDFQITDWVNNQITVIKSGVPVVPGEIGPHGISATCFDVTINKDDGTRFRRVFTNIYIDKATQNIILIKSGAYPNFKGRVIIEGVS